MVFVIIASGLFLVALTLLIVRNIQYVKIKGKYNEYIKAYNCEVKKFESLSNIIKNSRREGYYDLKLDSPEKGSGFATVRISVLEIEKYTNGMSKVQHNKFQYVAGPNDYMVSCLEYTKNTASDLMLTSSIIWLEVEESIKEKRLKKLKELESNT